MTIRDARIEEMDTVRTLMREYQQGLGTDLCFQSFDAELAGLPGSYAPPTGALLVICSDETVAGCGAFRRLSSDPTTCEMKRLYLRPEYRGGGQGMRLALELMRRASEAGYRRMVLDTLASMHAARAAYKRLGFYEIEPYYPNPLPGTAYLAADLGAKIEER